MVSIKEDGYIILRDELPTIVTTQFKMWAMNPANAHRGNAMDGKYYDEHDGEREYSCWWTRQPPMEMWAPIVAQLTPHIDMLLDDEWSIHCVDCITTAPNSDKMYAHIDTPYKYKEYTGVTECLGAQIIIPLDTFTVANGATMFYPSSHLSMFDTEDIEMNRESYNELLLEHGTTFIAEPGDVYIQHAGTLHSTMPNNTAYYRSALLINVLATKIIPEIRELDKNTDFIKLDNRKGQC